MFVSTHLIPEDFKFEPDEPAFVSNDEKVRIKAGSEVRVRIVGVRLDANECVRPRLCAVLLHAGIHAACAGDLAGQLEPMVSFDRYVVCVSVASSMYGQRDQPQPAGLLTVYLLPCLL